MRRMLNIRPKFAEGVGFELTELCSSPDYKSSALNLSAIPNGSLTKNRSGKHRFKEQNN